MTEIVEVRIKGQVNSNRYGSLSDGDLLRTDAAFARHLVEDCLAAEYTQPARQDLTEAPAELPADKPRRTRQKKES